MANRGRGGIGAIDFLVALLTGAAIALFLLWLTSRIVGVQSFETLPGYFKGAAQNIWTLIIGSGGIAAAFLAWLQIYTFSTISILYDEG